MRVKVDSELLTTGTEVTEARIVVRSGIECQYIVIATCKSCDHSQIDVLGDVNKLKCLHIDRETIATVDKCNIPDDCPLQKTTLTLSLDKDNLTTWAKNALSKAYNNQ